MPPFSVETHCSFLNARLDAVGVERFLYQHEPTMPMSRPNGQTTESLADYVRSLTDEVLAGTPYFIVDLEVRGHKGTRVVKVFVESDDELNHDDLAAISEEIGFLLEMEDAIDGSYTLEVSSPGIKRPLTLPRQFRKNIGRPLRVRYETEEGATKKQTGMLTDADDDAIELELAPDRTVRVAYEAINRAKIELPW